MNLENLTMDRRSLMKKITGLGISLAGLELLSKAELLNIVTNAEAAVGKTSVVMAQKGSITKKVVSVISKLGGINRFVKKGAKVVIKPNAAWARTPDQAANTHPEVVATIIRLCKKAGAGSIKVYEHACDDPRVSFAKSGIKAVCNREGVQMISPGDHHYKTVKIPQGKKMKSMKVISDILSADCYINVPIAKVHGSAIVTLAMKNHMGCVEDRGYWHRTGLHQCIADAATVLKPDLCIIDATRILLTRGPRGPGKVNKAGIILGSTDIVAIDALGTKLIGKKPTDIPHIVMGNKMGLGEIDFNKINVIKV